VRAATESALGNRAHLSCHTLVFSTTRLPTSTYTTPRSRTGPKACGSLSMNPAAMMSVPPASLRND